MITRSVFLVLIAAVSLQAQVTFDRILKANQEPQNWLTYSGSVYGQRYSRLSEITPANVKNLELQWIFQTRAPAEPAEKFEATPLVVDAESRGGARCGHRTTVLDVLASHLTAGARLLRPRESRISHPWRDPVYGHDRCTFDRN
jgi:hypothetical protein